MADHARSTDPAVQAQLDRLARLGPGSDVLGLDRITRLLDRLGNPHRSLPPTFHVAGTNGKGSTCAFLRAALEGDGRRVHVFTSPHLVRFNERIRIAGALIDDALLASLLDEVLSAGGDVGASLFEVTTAAAFLAFSRIPGDACVIEVGLGGRLDATNVLAEPVVCGIAQLGMDHEAFLGNDIVGIAREKAGIAKRGTPLVCLRYPEPLAVAIREVADEVGAPVLAQGVAWQVQVEGERLIHTDAAGGIVTPLPALAGPHQAVNLALAIAMLRAQNRLPVSEAAICRAPAMARWPARMQLLGDGPLVGAMGNGRVVWLDGGHNPAAGTALAAALDGLKLDSLICILGLLANKDPAGLLQPIASRIGRLIAVPVPDHPHHAPEALCAVADRLGIASTLTAWGLNDAARLVADLQPAEQPVLILGSLYLAGEALRLNDELPD